MTPKSLYAFALPALLFAVTSGASVCSAQTSTPTLDSEETAFLTLLNNFRAQNGAGPLQVSSALENSSSWMSNDMASKNYFSHTDSLGRDPFTRMAAFGYSYAPAGENIAAGNSDAQSTFNQWLTACDADALGNCTYAHRQNMLNPGFVVIGIGRAYNGAAAYRWYWTTDFGGVVDHTSSPGPTPPPTIISLSATPSTITAGQRTTLMWSVSGATAVSLDNGIGDVSNLTTASVAPAQTTTYTLTATNSGGSVTAQVIINVPAAVALPIINSFTATPATLAAGQTATLAWNVTGANSLVVNGASVSSTAGYMVVTPAQTTTYILTAANSAGTVNAQAVVTVAAPAYDTQAPTTPTLLSAVAKSASEVDLSWTASTDNAAVSGYQILRNGTVIGSAGANALAYADAAVGPSGSYSYAVRAYDAAGNYSGLSNSMQVTTPAAVAITTCPDPAMGAFTGCYYANTDLLGNPVLVRTDDQINFTWGNSSPATVLAPLNFSVRWQGIFNFNAGNYVFTATMSDGMRFYIDGNPVRFAWRDEGPSMYVNQQTLSQGNHLITVEYYEHTGTAMASLSWQSTTPTTGSGQQPIINSFSANPTTLAAGQTATLSWNVTGAISLAINGASLASSAGSMSVTPGQTTSYSLTAANSAGTTSAQVVLTVAATADTQPPTTPTLLSGVAKSASEIDLSWTASTDNVGVAGYQVIRNGSAVGSVSGASIAYADTSVSPNMSYSYVIKAYDASGNYSGVSNTVQVTTPGAAAVTTCPGPAAGAFTGCYYNNTDLTGNPALVRTDNQINFVWGSGSPANGITPMNFSVRWQGLFDFNAGNYVFTATMSDGVRLYIDGNPVRFAWRDQRPNMYVNQQTLSQGKHLVTVEYYEHTGTAMASLSWQNN